jgi:hypothetical protein
MKQDGQLTQSDVFGYDSNLTTVSYVHHIFYDIPTRLEIRKAKKWKREYTNTRRMFSEIWEPISVLESILSDKNWYYT